MNDRYLYKAKRKNWRELPKEEHWVYGYYARGFNECEEPIDIIFDPTTIYSSNGKTDGWDEIDPTTLCACTGLKDKNGKLIWENDIVRVKHTDGQEEYQENAKVSYTKRGFSPFSWEYYCDGCDVRCEILEIEVTGNIFDNLELLEVEE